MVFTVGKEFFQRTQLWMEKQVLMKEHIYMCLKHTKRCPGSFLIRDMQIKTTVRIVFTFSVGRNQNLMI